MKNNNAFGSVRDRLLIGLTSAAMVATLVPMPALAQTAVEVAPSDEAIVLADEGEAASQAVQTEAEEADRASEPAGAGTVQGAEAPSDQEADIDSWAALQQAIDNAPFGTPTTITLTQDLDGESDADIRVPESKDITIDMAGHTLCQKSAGQRVITNYGNLTLVGGTITSSIKEGAKHVKDGAGIYNGTGAALNMERCSVEGNIAGLHGGGIFNEKGGSAVLNDCTVSGNQIRQFDENEKYNVHISGGGICNIGTLQVHGGRIEGNAINTPWRGDCFGCGGGVHCEGVAILDSVSIARNKCWTGGGIFLLKGAMLTVIDCSIQSNSAGLRGGGIGNDGGILNLRGEMEIWDNEARCQEIPAYGKGGGVWYEAGQINVGDSVRVNGNWASGCGWNVLLFGNRKINVDRPLNRDAYIAVTLMERTGTFTSGYGEHNGGDDPNRFFSMDKGLNLRITDAGEVEVGEFETEAYSQVTFHGNTPTGAPADRTQDVPKGKTTKLRKNDFSCEGYVFKGWNTKADGTGESYADGAEVTPNGDMELFAQWEKKKPEGELASFGYSVTLGDSIDIVFNVKDLVDDPENYTVEYGPTDGEMQAARLSDPKLNTFTVASCTASQMSDTFDVVVRHEDEVIKEARYSVKDYCQKAIERGANSKKKQDKAAVDICKATLDYGSYAQQAEKYHTDNLANDGKDFFDNASIDIPVVDSRVSGSCDGITGQTISLNTTSRTQFVVLFKHAKGADKADYEFTVDGKSYDASKVIDRNGKFEVWIDGIAARDLAKEHTVTVSKGGKTYSYTASPVVCMSKAIHGDKPVDEPGIFRALYNYHLKAVDYFAAVAK